MGTTPTGRIVYLLYPLLFLIPFHRLTYLLSYSYSSSNLVITEMLMVMPTLFTNVWGGNRFESWPKNHPGSLDFLYYSCYNLGMAQRTGRPRTGIKPNTSIRIDPDILHQARIDAVTQRKTLGQWLEEAIVEKIKREQKRRESKNESSALRKGKHR